MLAQLLVSQPELLTTFASSETLAAVKQETAFRGALGSALAPALTAAEVRDRLRRTKQAEELGIVWRYLLGVTTLEQYSREMTALAEAALAVGWLRAKTEQAERRPTPSVPAVLVGMGKLGGRELTTGSDLDIFVVYGAPPPPPTSSTPAPSSGCRACSATSPRRASSSRSTCGSGRAARAVDSRRASTPSGGTTATTVISGSGRP